MGRPLRSIPPSVWYVLAILGLNVLGGLLLAAWVAAVVAAGLIAAVLSRLRMAWRWSRLVGALGGGLLFFVGVIGLFMSNQAGKTDGILLAGAQMIDGLLALAACYAMNRRSALQYFDLICPACGADSVQADDFLFQTARCPRCAAVWTNSTDYVRPESAGGPSDWPAQAHGADPGGVLDVLPVTDEAFTSTPRPAPAPLAPGVAPTSSDQSKHRRAVLIVLAGGLALLLACGGVLFFGGSRFRSRDGWIILFRSRDPRIWNRNVDRGPNDFAQRLEGAPEDMAYLRLTNKATGDFVILPLRKDQLHHRVGERRFGWDGTADFEHQAHHLGIPNRVWGGGVQGDVFVSDFPHCRGWGFGHVIDENNRQGYCWNARPIPPTVFEIAVKKGPLTTTEVEKLLEEK